jgi:hypothetical protein
MRFSLQCVPDTKVLRPLPYTFLLLSVVYLISPSSSFPLPMRSISLLWVGVFPDPDSADRSLHFSPTCEEYIPACYGWECFPTQTVLTAPSTFLLPVRSISLHVMWGVFPDPDSAGSSLHFSPTCEEYIPFMWGVFPNPDSAGRYLHFLLPVRSISLLWGSVSRPRQCWPLPPLLSYL